MKSVLGGLQIVHLHSISTNQESVLALDSGVALTKEAGLIATGFESMPFVFALQ